jgi:hypothetical protein
MLNCWLDKKRLQRQKVVDVNQFVHSPYMLFRVDETMDEQSSYNFLSMYELSFPYYHHYTKDDYPLDSLVSAINTFSMFHGRVKILSDETMKHSVVSALPLDVFRYKMLSDGSWYFVKTTRSRRKEGYIVEGASWSNGMYYVVREEQNSSGIFIDAHLYIDQYTKDLYSYP